MQTGGTTSHSELVSERGRPRHLPAAAAASGEPEALYAGIGVAVGVAAVMTAVAAFFIHMSRRSTYSTAAAGGPHNAPGSTKPSMTDAVETLAGKQRGGRRSEHASYSSRWVLLLGSQGSRVWLCCHHRHVLSMAHLLLVAISSSCLHSAAAQLLAAQPARSLPTPFIHQMSSSR
jgi:hypothetical protein